MEQKQYRAYSIGNLDSIPEVGKLSGSFLERMRAVATVLPFRTNNYVTEELIDWSKIPADPIFQLTFPQPGMLHEDDIKAIESLIRQGASRERIDREVWRIRRKMNPHPAGQLKLNVPREGGETFHGMQHKYDETLLFFPSQGQTCHAYCTYCFRWAQFIGMEELRMASMETKPLIRYLNSHPEVTDLLITGGDPMFMRSTLLRRYIEPILKARPGGLKTIRIGTKSLSYWPYRFTTDKDSEDVLTLFREVVNAGFHLAVMAHFTHIRELSTEAVASAIGAIQRTGAVIRCQSPVVRHINDSADMWARMWQEEVEMGMVPYYMFIPRDTGPRDYFNIPLERALKLFSDAYRQVSGLARTVRGPSMSAKPGKILVDGISRIGGKKYFVLKVIQGRNASWVNRVFFAEYDPEASWISELHPAFGERRFFFEEGNIYGGALHKPVRNVAVDVKPEMELSSPAAPFRNPRFKNPECKESNN
jgi:L-lysine 2,3-aminomutase